MRKCTDPTLPFPGVDPHVRIGISTNQLSLDKPLGSEAFSFSYRDVNGHIYHDGKSAEFAEPYQINDTIGVLLIMSPPLPKQLSRQPEVQFPQFTEHKSVEKITSDTSEPPLSIAQQINQGSGLYFFKNGVYQGQAAQNLEQDYYYVGASLYMKAEVQFNLGPKFQFEYDYSQIKNELLINSKCFAYNSVEQISSTRSSVIRPYCDVARDLPNYPGIASLQM